MASLLLNEPAFCDNLSQFAQNPLFAELRVTLLEECEGNLPYGLLTDMPVSVEQEELRKEFKSLSHFKDDKVIELETFYNTQSTTIEMRRHEALGQLVNLDPVDVDAEIDYIHIDHDRQQDYLVSRVRASLQLLKTALEQQSLENKNGGNNSNSKQRSLNPKAIAIMSEWYQRNIEHPYPSDEEKEIIAERGGITVSQVKGWFANKRNRSYNTKPKRQQRQMEEKLYSICHQLSNNERPPQVYHDIISQLSDVLMTSEMASYCYR